MNRIFGLTTLTQCNCYELIHTMLYGSPFIFIFEYWPRRPHSVPPPADENLQCVHFFTNAYEVFVIIYNYVHTHYYGCIRLHTNRCKIHTSHENRS